MTALLSFLDDPLPGLEGSELKLNIQAGLTPTGTDLVPLGRRQFYETRQPLLDGNACPERTYTQGQTKLTEK